MTKVCLGGTFNVIHEGHVALLRRACSEGHEIFIGLTSDPMARNSRSARVNDYTTRLRRLIEALKEICPGKAFIIREINDAMGPAATSDFDVIVVSRETVQGAERINDTRAAVGLKPLRVVVVDMVLGANGKRLSSTDMVREKPFQG